MEKYKIQKPDPEIALKLLSYTGIRKLGYHNNKNFCIKAIKKSIVFMKIYLIHLETT